jgi:streptomycin 6-kinase
MSLQLPTRFRERIARVFGEQGEQWLDHLPDLFAASVAKWRLTGVCPSTVLSHSLVCFADSPCFGRVVLKIGVPEHELLTEMAALSAMTSPFVRRCYAADVELGAMLLELVAPGNDLRSVADSAQRAQIAAQLIAATPETWHPATAARATADGQAVRFPRLGEWAQRAFARARDDGIAPPRMLRLVDVAEQLFASIESPGMPLYLIHGDLNHYNMLQDATGKWRVIDPKGAVTVRTAEAGRFVINELGFLPADLWPSALTVMAKTIGAALDEPPQRVLLCAFFDRVLSTCWSYQDRGQKDRTADLVQAEAILTAYETAARSP